MLPSIATDKTQSVGSSTGVMIPSFTILSNSFLTLEHMEIGHFLGVCMTGWVLSHSMMVYSLGNWPMPWSLSGNFLMRSSIDLIGTVFLSVGAAGMGPGRWEVSWMTLTVQFILTTSNFSCVGAPGLQDQGCLPHINRSLSGVVVHWETRLPDNRPTK